MPEHPHPTSNDAGIGQANQRIRVGGSTALAQFSCEKCGAKLEYAPGTTLLRCQYCSHENHIPEARDADGQVAVVQELALESGMALTAKEGDAVTVSDIECGACKAVFLPAPNVTATACPFCGTNLVLTKHSSVLIKPGSVLPFGITREQATSGYRKWITSRWFAPNKLKSRAMLDTSLRGVYTPAWTYDANTVTHYSGQRGDAYYVTVGSGKNQRRERRIRWTSVSGVVSNSFDDVLVLGSHTLPKEKAEALEPWDLDSLVPYEDSYLAGFTSESYTVDLRAGFEEAKQIMQRTIESTIRSDIGGDEQRISSMNTRYSDLTYKHILLPVWVSAYRFGDKLYQFLVNARTGEVQGQRPYSWIKITLAVLAGLIVVAIIVLVANSK